ncbi:myo-inosose-2 dehydratase [Rhodanobacter sp. MP1X3]|jgi:inosose dehydratase|uniref:myo-inosose-2 dehydratase n=1 Tax=Rhodanobacter sp. MP1X3 TaxID=2723086 RepID=UPI001610FDD9|nr:myo-inosose-2 dehydratase [Rhodanobacter sp. MP1X3]MBB6244321.1 inosose dehydratase [Rhodanobacter sp. MP1X3]
MSEILEVKIGINPISWSNDDLPSLGGEIPLSTALSEGREIGYQGFELGNKFPKDPAALRELMAGYQLDVVSGWYSGRLATRSVEEEIAAVESHLNLLAENGCKVMVYGEVANAIQGERKVPLYKRPHFDDDAFKRYGERLTAFGKHLLTRGVRLGYHHHMGAYVESPDDIDRVMAYTGEDVGLLFDSGHAYFGGGDPLTILGKHIGRVCHVHCKDVRPAIIRHARNRQWSFLDSVLNGVFTVPGDGAIDFAGIIELLRKNHYKGWLIVEAEQDPAVAPSYAYASLGYRTLRGLVDGVRTKEAA